jgi:hypothetical protein
MTESKPLTLGDLTRKRKQIATWDYVHEVERALDLHGDLAERVADFVANEIERVGGSDARLVMIVDESNYAGTGPWCSWCWSIGGLCPHLVGRPDDGKEASR